MCFAPPSSRSSLVGEVSTTYLIPISFTAFFRFSGSFGSRGGGFFDFSIAQKEQYLVQILPIIRKVAVCLLPKHSDMFGHSDSSQTVCNLYLLRISFILCVSENLTFGFISFASALITFIILIFQNMQTF